MKKLKKLVEEISRVIEEEYDEVMSYKNENEEYKRVVKNLLETTKMNISPLKKFACIFSYMGMEHTKDDELKRMLQELERKIFSKAKEMGF